MAKPKKKLTKMQEVFVNLMVYQDLNQSECAFRAGFKNPEVIASRMMNNPEYLHVQERIQQMKALQRKKYDINFENVGLRETKANGSSIGPHRFVSYLSPQVRDAARLGREHVHAFQRHRSGVAAVLPSA